MTDRIEEVPGSARVVARTDVLVVGGGPSGLAAAIAARREGCSVTLIERYPYLGGLASGGLPDGPRQRRRSARRARHRGRPLARRHPRLRAALGACDQAGRAPHR